jgi:septum site-determining protein MinD
MGQCIAVVSGKGGTGKTSLTAGVGAALALAGHTVLCVDCDIGLRNLDIALGMSDCAVTDFTDVLEGRYSLKEAATPHPIQKNLYLLTAPSNPSRPIDAAAFARPGCAP